MVGIHERRYLDATGLVRHRSIGDLMRYAALNQGMDLLAHFGGFVPVTADVGEEPGGFLSGTVKARYSDEQLYALRLAHGTGQS